jgi:hypothetical protein
MDADVPALVCPIAVCAENEKQIVCQ